MRRRKVEKKLQKSRLIFWLSRLAVLVLADILLVFFLTGTTYRASEDPKVRDFSIAVNIAPYPTVQSELVPLISASSYLVVDGASGVVIASWQGKERLYPASLTKLMTALVALDYYRLDDVVTVKRLSPVEGEVEMGLSIGDRITVRNLLYGLLVPSGNDAAFALADSYSGGIENFVYSMNQKAKELNMLSTHFVNPNGSDSLDQYTTAYDLVVLARKVMNNEEIKQIVATSSVVLTDALGEKSYSLKNVNQLLGTVNGVDGIKTGFTDLAGQCLIARAKRGERTIFSVVLKSYDRFADSARLLEWAFRNTRWEKISLLD